MTHHHTYITLIMILMGSIHTAIKSTKEQAPVYSRAERKGRKTNTRERLVWCSM